MTLDVHHAPGLALIDISSFPRLPMRAAVSDPARNRDDVPSQPLASPEYMESSSWRRSTMNASAPRLAALLCSLRPGAGG